MFLILGTRPLKHITQQKKHNNPQNKAKNKISFCKKQVSLFSTGKSEEVRGQNQLKNTKLIEIQQHLRRLDACCYGA